MYNVFKQHIPEKTQLDLYTDSVHNSLKNKHKGTKNTVAAFKEEYFCLHL